jgi:hypothetical protein
MHVTQDTSFVLVARNKWKPEVDRKILNKIVAYMKASMGKTPGVAVLQTPIPTQPGGPNRNYTPPVPGAWLVTGVNLKV